MLLFSEGNKMTKESSEYDTGYQNGSSDTTDALKGNAERIIVERIMELESQKLQLQAAINELITIKDRVNFG
jgi:hypothetical protein